MSTEPVETFVFLPYPKYKALDNRAKKVEEQVEPAIAESQSPILAESTPNEEAPPSISQPESMKEKEVDIQLGKNMTKTYRGVQIRKLLHHIEKTKGATEVTSFANLEELIKAALTNTRRKLPNEEVFFTFLFDKDLGHFVKNRSKIDLYYKYGPWYLL